MTETKASGPDPESAGPTQLDDEELQVQSPRNATGRIDGLVAWALLSLGFLAFITFGSVDARIWRFNNLQIESRSVLRIWTLQAESLPRVAQQWMLTSLFYACILAVVVGTITGIWLLLDSAGTGSSRTQAAADDSSGDPA